MNTEIDEIQIPEPEDVETTTKPVEEATEVQETRDSPKSNTDYNNDQLHNISFDWSSGNMQQAFAKALAKEDDDYVQRRGKKFTKDNEYVEDSCKRLAQVITGQPGEDVENFYFEVFKYLQGRYPECFPKLDGFKAQEVDSAKKARESIAKQEQEAKQAKDDIEKSEPVNILSETEPNKPHVVTKDKLAPTNGSESKVGLVKANTTKDAPTKDNKVEPLTEETVESQLSRYNGRSTLNKDAVENVLRNDAGYINNDGALVLTSHVNEQGIPTEYQYEEVTFDEKMPTQEEIASQCIRELSEEAASQDIDYKTEMIKWAKPECKKDAEMLVGKRGYYVDKDTGEVKRIPKKFIDSCCGETPEQQSEIAVKTIFLNPLRELGARTKERATEVTNDYNRRRQKHDEVEAQMLNYKGYSTLSDKAIRNAISQGLGYIDEKGAFQNRVDLDKNGNAVEQAVDYNQVLETAINNNQPKATKVRKRTQPSPDQLMREPEYADVDEHYDAGRLSQLAHGGGTGRIIFVIVGIAVIVGVLFIIGTFIAKNIVTLICGAVALLLIIFLCKVAFGRRGGMGMGMRSGGMYSGYNRGGMRDFGRRNNYGNGYGNNYGGYGYGNDYNNRYR